MRSWLFGIVLLATGCRQILGFESPVVGDSAAIEPRLLLSAGSVTVVRELNARPTATGRS